MPNGEWNKKVLSLLPSQLERDILSVPINQLLDRDEIIWCPTLSGEYSNNSAYGALSKDGQAQCSLGKVGSP